MHSTTSEIRALTENELESVSGGINFDDPYVRAVGTLLGIAATYVGGKIWNWLFG